MAVLPTSPGDCPRADCPRNLGGPFEGVVLYLVPLRSDVPTAVRLRRLLKAAKRAFGFRLVRLEGTIAED